MKKSDLKQIIKECINEAVGSIYNPKAFDPLNPEIKVQGMGIFHKKGLEENIIKKLEDLVSRAKSGDWGFVHARLTEKHAVLLYLIQALIDANVQMETPEMKRKVTMMTMKNDIAQKHERKKI